MSQEQSQSPKVLIVDDHPLVAAGFQSGLASKGWDVAIAHSYEAAHKKLADAQYDFCIIDINLPDGMGSDLLSETDLKGKIPEKTLLISGNDDPDDIMIALEKGASAFITKAADFHDLMKAIEVIASIPKPEDPLFWDVQRKIFIPVKRAFPRGTVLSAKEREVFSLMRQGRQDKEIAYSLGRSIHTVRVQIRNIRRKRGMTRRAAIVA